MIDTDGDGLLDRWEMVLGTRIDMADTDGDGFSDFVEVQHGYNPLGPGARATDSDQDGLSDVLELRFGSDLGNLDTDGDGALDGAELEAGYSPTSTSAVPLTKSLRVILATQTLELYLDGTLYEQYLISSGKPGMATPVGEYTILNKHPRAWSNSAKLWMPYWMAFTTRGHGLHELPEWPGGKKEGADHLGKPVSHGCVRMGVGAAKRVYEWAPIGTHLTIVKK